MTELIMPIKTRIRADRGIEHVKRLLFHGQKIISVNI